MGILLTFAFLGGIVTILSPCILPLLPIILSSQAGSVGLARPYGIITGFIASFTLATLFLSTVVQLLGISPESLRNFAVIVIAGFGLSLLLPRLQLIVESLFARVANTAPSTTNKSGFGGGILIGLSLGLLWTPCVGPILASVISLALTGEVTGSAAMITLAYSLGTAIPLFIVMRGGQALFQHHPWILKNTHIIQRVFGLIMIVTAIMIQTGADRTFQTYILSKFPQYGTGLTKLEDNLVIRQKLDEISRPQVDLLEKNSYAPELKLGGQWFNTDPVTIKEFQGKVVLVDFWTYTCINCIRTIPYLNAWHEKYSDKGLVIIGVHSPEFEFEKSADNVSKAIADFGIKYGVMQDNEFATWRAYGNRYWPAKYLIDKDGYVRYHHAGEGSYDETEQAIQDLLVDAGQVAESEIKNISTKNYSRTHELYLGSLRYDESAPLTWSKGWERREEYSLAQPGATLILEYEAADVFLVMKPRGGDRTVQVFEGETLLKTISVGADSLYTLIDSDLPESREIRLVFPDGNVEIYAFTFG